MTRCPLCSLHHEAQVACSEAASRPVTCTPEVIASVVATQLPARQREIVIRAALIHSRAFAAEMTTLGGQSYAWEHDVARAVLRAAERAIAAGEEE
jgi:hypothetical protein